LNGPIWIAITVFALIYGTQVPIFSCAPTAVCGYAVTAGYCIHAVDGAMIPMISTMAITNPVVSIVISIIIGSIFGMLSGKLAKAIGG
jgi:tetrahydromethanopterin S-methyltransferase subunit C